MRNCDCKRARFGPASHVRGAYTHAVPAAVRLTSWPRCEMSAPPWTRHKIRAAYYSFDQDFRLRFFFLPGPRGGAHLTAGLWGQANNRWHGTGMGAPDMRCGAKPCPVKPVTATVEYFGEYLVIILGGVSFGGTRSISVSC